MKKSSNMGIKLDYVAENLWPAYIILNLAFALALLVYPARDFFLNIFGPSSLRIVVLTELFIAVVAAVRMGVVEKAIYKITEKKSIWLVIAAAISLVLLFNMIDQIFGFFLLFAFLVIIDLYAIEALEKFYPGNIFLIVLLYAVAIFKYTESIPLILLFSLQYIFGARNRKTEPYDWTIFLIYFIIPLVFYATGSLSLMALWAGLYFIFKAGVILLEKTGAELFDIGEKIRKLAGVESKKGKYFWSAKEDLIFAVILLLPIFFRLVLKKNSEEIIASWLITFFILTAVSLMFVDPGWWKKYRGEKSN